MHFLLLEAFDTEHGEEGKGFADFGFLFVGDVVLFGEFGETGFGGRGFCASASSFKFRCLYRVSFELLSRGAGHGFAKPLTISVIDGAQVVTLSYSRRAAEGVTLHERQFWYFQLH
jgi:hypothetical protein